MRSSKMNALRTFFVILAMVIPASAHAETPTWEGSVGWLVRTFHSSSVDALSANDRELFGAVSVLRHFSSLDVLGLQVSAGLELEGGVVSGTTFQRLESRLAQRSYGAVLRARRPVKRWLTAMGSVSLGLTTADLELEGANASSGLVGSARGASFSWLGGLEVPWRLGRRGEVALQLLVGHRAITTMSFSARPEGTDDSLDIETQGTELGDINLSSWTYQMGLLVRY
jgi:hypothetical protein